MTKKHWAVAVTTAPRPVPTLNRTLASLGRAGFDGVQVFDDAGRKGAWPNWLLAVQTLLQRHAEADALLLCQDDAVFCRGLREYLDRTLWPDAGERPGVALCSPYCPGPYRRKQSGWHQQKRGWYLVGALCWALPRRAAEAVLRDLGTVRANDRIDARVGKWASETDRSVWYHSPSLVQHVGNENSALGDCLAGDLRRATDFIGENGTAGKPAG